MLDHICHLSALDNTYSRWIKLFFAFDDMLIALDNTLLRWIITRFMCRITHFCDGLIQNKNVLSNTNKCYSKWRTCYLMRQMFYHMCLCVIQCNYARTCNPMQERFIQLENVLINANIVLSNVNCEKVLSIARNVLYLQRKKVIFDKKNWPIKIVTTKTN